MAISAPNATRALARRYFPIHLDTLRANKLFDFDLYISIEGEMVLYCEQSLLFSDESRKRLFDSKVQQVYVDRAQRHQVLGYMERELPLLLHDDRIPPLEKASIMYTTSKLIVEEVFERPTIVGNIKRTEALVGNTVSFLTGSADAFRNLVLLSAQDYTLYSHSVHVCTFALGLAQGAGIQDPAALQALGVGAILHDVGTTRIDTRVMRKRAPLSHEEFELMKRHVELGVGVLKETDAIPPMAYIPVLQHQEREDGTGYPAGLKGDEIHVFGKITGIADVFDAITTSRVYSDAMPTFDAFKVMLSLPLESGLVRKFIRLLGPQ
jgi:HD-GYP domain-containing protein (c-di-GMP phosphodiesterase class II)